MKGITKLYTVYTTEDKFNIIHNYKVKIWFLEVNNPTVNKKYNTILNNYIKSITGLDNISFKTKNELFNFLYNFNTLHNYNNNFKLIHRYTAYRYKDYTISRRFKLNSYGKIEYTWICNIYGSNKLPLKDNSYTTIKELVNDLEKLDQKN